MTCKYLSNGSNNYVTVQPGGNSPIINCANYTSCEISPNTFNLQCSKCNEGFLEGKPASATKGVCSASSDPNPSTCYKIAENTASNEKWVNCPNGYFQVSVLPTTNQRLSTH